MTKKLRLSVISPSGTILCAEASGVTLPLTDGYCGILPGHGEMIAVTTAGTLKYSLEGAENSVEIGAGIAKVDADSVTVLTA